MHRTTQLFNYGFLVGLGFGGVNVGIGTLPQGEYPHPLSVISHPRQSHPFSNNLFNQPIKYTHFLFPKTLRFLMIVAGSTASILFSVAFAFLRIIVDADFTGSSD